MRLICGAICCALLSVLGFSCGEQAALAAMPQTSRRVEMRPEVAALVQQALSAYQRLNTYQHTAITEEIKNGVHVGKKRRYTLALARPNRFRFTVDSGKEITVDAVCNGKTFILLHGPQREYTETPAPATYAKLDLIDKVVIEPLGTYIVAVLLQGDPYADPEIRSVLKAATLRAVVEKGRKWQILVTPYFNHVELDFYFDAQTHLLGKAVFLFPDSSGPSAKIIEIIQNIKLDKPLDDSVFRYALPPDARKVKEFTLPTLRGNPTLAPP